MTLERFPASMKKRKAIESSGTGPRLDYHSGAGSALDRSTGINVCGNRCNEYRFLYVSFVLSETITFLMRHKHDVNRTGRRR